MIHLGWLLNFLFGFVRSRRLRLSILFHGFVIGASFAVSDNKSTNRKLEILRMVLHCSLSGFREVKMLRKDF